MKIKEQRWYEIENGLARVYDAPIPEKSQSVSSVSVSDLAYYRANFDLEKIWVSPA